MPGIVLRYSRFNSNDMERKINYNEAEWYGGGMIIKPGTQNYRMLTEEAVLKRVAPLLSEIRNTPSAEIHVVISAQAFMKYRRDHPDRDVIVIPTSEKVGLQLVER